MLVVLVLLIRHTAPSAEAEAAAAASATGVNHAGGTKSSDPKVEDATAARIAQPLLRLVALVVGWSLTLSVSTYCLFGSRFLGYDQPQLSMTFSAGAAITIFTQLLLIPRLVRSIGPHSSCSLGLLGVSLGLGGCSVLRAQPVHSSLYLLNRVGSGVADTSTATLVALASADKQDRARNLGLIQSTRAAARIVTPMLSGYLFARSCSNSTCPGALPYLVVSALALLLIPLPRILRRMQRQREAGPGTQAVAR